MKAFEMPHVSDEMARLSADADRCTAMLAETAGSICRRLQPHNLVEAAKATIGSKANMLTGNIGDYLKDNSGKIALFAAGTLAAYELGSRAQGNVSDTSRAKAGIPHQRGHSVETNEGLEPLRAPGREAAASDLPPVPGSRRAHRRTDPAQKRAGHISTSDTIRAWIVPAFAVVASYFVAKAIPVTETEERLVGGITADMSRELRSFWRQHRTGAQQAAAQAFGVADAGAGMLGILAACARNLGRGRDQVAKRQMD